MDQRSQVREYVTTVWNYNQGVVDAFDDEDYKIVENTTSFKLWVLEKTFIALAVASINPLTYPMNKIKKAFK